MRPLAGVSDMKNELNGKCQPTCSPAYAHISFQGRPSMFAGLSVPRFGDDSAVARTIFEREYELSVVLPVHSGGEHTSFSRGHQRQVTTARSRFYTCTAHH